MADMVVDSSVLIDYLRGRREATDYLDHLREAGSLATHAVVVAEVLVGARDLREQASVDRLFQEFRVFAISESDSFASLELLKRYRLSHGVGWMDCLIVATCLRHGMPIATLNERHFALFRDLQVHRPY